MNNNLTPASSLDDTHHTGVNDPLRDSLASLSVGRCHVAVEPSHVKGNHADYGEPQQQNVAGLPVLKYIILSTLTESNRMLCSLLFQGLGSFPHRFIRFDKKLDSNILLLILERI